MPRPPPLLFLALERRLAANRCIGQRVVVRAHQIDELAVALEAAVAAAVGAARLAGPAADDVVALDGRAVAVDAVELAPRHREFLQPCLHAQLLELRAQVVSRLVHALLLRVERAQHVALRVVQQVVKLVQVGVRVVRRPHRRGAALRRRARHPTLELGGRRRRQQQLRRRHARLRARADRADVAAQPRVQLLGVDAMLAGQAQPGARGQQPGARRHARRAGERRAPQQEVVLVLPGDEGLQLGGQREATVHGDVADHGATALALQLPVRRALEAAAERRRVEPRPELHPPRATAVAAVA